MQFIKLIVKVLVHVAISYELGYPFGTTTSFKTKRIIILVCDIIWFRIKSW